MVSNSHETQNQREVGESSLATTPSQSSQKKRSRYETFQETKRCKVDNTMKQALDTLKEVRQKAEKQNEFTLFGQEVGVHLNKLSLQKALETQQKINNILMDARLSELRESRVSFRPMEMQSSTPSTTYSSTMSKEIEVVPSPTSETLTSLENCKDTSDDDGVQMEEENRVSIQREQLTTYFANWKDQQFQ